MKLKRLNIQMLIVSISLCVIDLFIKYIIVQIFNKQPYPYTDSISLIGNFFKLTYVQNFGITFGMLTELPDFATAVIITIISLIAMGVLVYFYKNLRSYLQEKVMSTGYICLSIIMGGALGNIIDRLMRGYVVDYLDFGIMNYRWYTFNFADICIVSGCILLTILMTFFEEKNEQTQ
ncbi:MAG: signal peptidase II [Brevinema sp.]